MRRWHARASKLGQDIEIPTKSGNLDGRMRTTVRTDAGSLLAREGPARAAYFRQALAFLHEHAFRSRDERRIWAMHANGGTIDDIAVAANFPRARIQRAITRLARTMRAPKRGRPIDPESRGRHAYQVPGVRLNTTETEAFVFLLQRLNANKSDIIRLCIRSQALLVAQRICARTAADTPVPRREGTER